jgi:hypothetical protein
MSTTAPKFEQTFCSQCGDELGPGDEGCSDCRDHDLDGINNFDGVQGNDDTNDDGASDAA